MNCLHVSPKERTREAVPCGMGAFIMMKYLVQLQFIKNMPTFLLYNILIRYFCYFIL